MIKYRAEFGQRVNRWAGGFGRAESTLASTKPERIGTFSWLAALLIWIVGSFILIRFLGATTAQYVMAALWGVFVGGTMLIFFHQKLLITIIGGIVGTGVSDLAGLAQVIDKTAAIILKITTTLNSALQDAVTIKPAAAWIFLSLVALCCLPAYRDQC